MSPTPLRVAKGPGRNRPGSRWQQGAYWHAWVRRDPLPYETRGPRQINTPGPADAPSVSKWAVDAYQTLMGLDIVRMISVRPGALGESGVGHLRAMTTALNAPRAWATLTYREASPLSRRSLHHYLEITRYHCLRSGCRKGTSVSPARSRYLVFPVARYF